MQSTGPVLSSYKILHDYPSTNMTENMTTWQLDPEGLTTHSPVFVPCRNPDNLLTERTAHVVELVMHAGIFPVLTLTGVITNVINMVVFARQGLNDRINLCLFSLAGADMGYLLLLMCMMSYTLLGLVDQELGSYWQERRLNTVLGVFTGFLNTSNAMTTVIAVERCICIVAPFRAKSLLKTKYMAVLIACIYVYVLGLYGIMNVKYVTVRVHDTSSKEVSYVSRLGSFYLRNKLVIDFLHNYLLTIAIPAVSFVVIIVTTSLIVNKLRSSLAWHRQSNAAMTSAERREVAVTSMLTMVCCVYVICMTPSVTVTVVLNLLPDFLPTGRFCNTFKVTLAFVHFLEALNSSANFYIYLMRGSRYRSTLSQLCCCTARPRASPSTQDVTSDGKGLTAAPSGSE